MSEVTYYIPEAVSRLRACDPRLKRISLYDKFYTDEDIAELVDCLLAHPDIVICVYIINTHLTDETGVKLARYLAISSVIQSLGLRNNKFGEATYLAIAAALSINTSLRNLQLHYNQPVDTNRIDGAFIDALILNPNRSIHSDWMLYSRDQDDFDRLKVEANRLGHPSMQALLAMPATRLIKAF